MDYELQLVPSDMPSLDKFQGNMNSICLQRVWRWRFGKASGGEDKLPLWLWDRRRPSAPLFELFCVGRTVAIIMWPVIEAPCKSLVSPPTEQIAQIGFSEYFWYRSNYMEKHGGEVWRLIYDFCLWTDQLCIWKVATVGLNLKHCKSQT